MNSNIAKSKAKPGSLPADIRVAGVREVNGYLRKHPRLAKLVPAICLRTREEFGAAAELTIRLNHDQEIHDPYLVLDVRLPSYAPDTRKRIDAVWQQFEEQLCGLSGWIVLTTDFRKVNVDGVRMARLS